MTGTVRRWPLALIAAPAAVSIWSGWVGLGGMCGFGVVHPLPGILPQLRIDTALTLPLGIESYAALALGAWLRAATAGRARTFARWSALGSLVLGMLGQVSYHLLAAAHAARAPDLVVVLVSCLPVVVLGCAVALLHLLSAAVPAAEHTAPGVPEPSTESVSVPAALNGHAEQAVTLYAAEVERGAVPSIRRIRREMHVGQPRAEQVQQYLAGLAPPDPVSGGAARAAGQARQVSPDHTTN